jgi:class 3 adenylate cyclase
LLAIFAPDLSPKAFQDPNWRVLPRLDVETPKPVLFPRASADAGRGSVATLRSTRPKQPPHQMALCEQHNSNPIACLVKLRQFSRSMLQAGDYQSATAVRSASGQILHAAAKRQEEHTRYPVQGSDRRREPIGRERDLFGATVQLAAQFFSHAQPDHILVSSVVAE